MTETPEMTPQTGKRDSRSILLCCLLAVLTVGIIVSCVFSITTSRQVKEVYTKAMGEVETREDDVEIMNGQYVIRSTLPISDAYKSGDTSKLSDKEKETLEMASAVLDEIITDGMTDYEKELAVYDWMTKSLEYDRGVLTVIPQTQADGDNPYGVLKYHNAVCVGYATTFRLFMQMMDIECMVVHNTDRYHSWDLVKLDDEWYHVDIYSDQGSGNYANFNMNDEMASQGHDWDREFFPAATGLKYNYAVQNKQDCTDIYDVPSIMRTALDEQNGLVAIGFETIDEAHAEIVESMMREIDGYVSGGSFGDLWMYWSWIHTTGNSYVLCAYISGFENGEEGQDFTISDEDQQKISDAVSAAFADAMEGVDEIGGDIAYDVTKADCG